MTHRGQSATRSLQAITRAKQSLSQHARAERASATPDQEEITRLGDLWQELDVWDQAIRADLGLRPPRTLPPVFELGEPAESRPAPGHGTAS